MLILGVDPGSRCTGYGFVQALASHRVPAHVAHGAILVAPRDAVSARLHAIYEHLENLIMQHRPKAMALESVFMHKNVNSAIKLGQARGVALAAAGAHDLPVFEYTPRRIKQAVAGYGSAEKTQVQWMIQHLLQPSAPCNADAADALAAALCHAFNHPAHPG